MKFSFRGHHYNTQIKHNLRTMLWLDNYNGWRWRYLHTTWTGHGDDCCDYWTPIHMPDGSVNPKVKRAFILDDELAILNPDDDTTVNDLATEGSGGDDDRQ